MAVRRLSRRRAPYAHFSSPLAQPRCMGNYSGQEEILATNFTNGANFLRVIREIRAIRGKG